MDVVDLVARQALGEGVAGHGAADLPHPEAIGTPGEDPTIGQRVHDPQIRPLGPGGDLKDEAHLAREPRGGGGPEGAVGVDRHVVVARAGEPVGHPGALFPECGIEWTVSPAVVHRDAWPALAAPERNAPYTTVTNWWGKYEVLNGETVGNYKRTHFMECLDLPSRVDVKIELAVHHEEGQPSEMDKLRSHGFRARAASEVSRTPLQYHRYITGSRGEFSCAKPSCMLLQNAWISDRTLCYLASGRPAIVQHTGPSKLLPEMEGLLRFHDVDGAERCIKAVEANYDHHAAAARALVEKHFAADKVLSRLLERAMALPARSHHDQQ